MASTSDLPGLSELFHAGWNVQKKIDSAELVASNEEFSVKVENAIRQLEDATRLVSELNMFSKNESFEEIATADLIYILLPALLGDLVSQLMNDNDRIVSLQRAGVYFVDFLQRCKDYAITSQEIPSITDDSEVNVSENLSRIQKPKAMEQLAAERREKIIRLRAKKETESKLRELDKVIQSRDSSRQPDDETIREHILTLLNLWVYKALDNINSIKQEISLLEQMKQIKKELPPGAVLPPPIEKDSSRLPSKPFVITKDMLKDKVFGAGYPSLPTMTVEEFYEQNYGNLQPPETDNNSSQNIGADEREETEEEEEERLKRERDFDEFKDENRRGWGNRKNQG